MPELPEVETVTRILAPQLKRKKIEAVEVNRRVVVYPAESEFIEKLTGDVFSDVRRRGKFLFFMFESGSRLIVHLRMTGSLFVTPADAPVDAHTHVVIKLDGGGELRFVDPRRFGRMWLIGKNKTDNVSGAGKLGREPDDGELTAETLKSAFGKRGLPLKQALLDQTVVAGIGNIYSDEICFAAGIRPDRPSKSLTDAEWTGVRAKISEIIAAALSSLNEITPEEYLRDKGAAYRRKPSFMVYGHAGQPCPVCGTPIERKVIGGRSSCYCPRCQK